MEYHEKTSTLFRYPGEVIEPDKDDVYEAIIKAERIYSLVKEKTQSKI